jgi:hypothetical protein
MTQQDIQRLYAHLCEDCLRSGACIVLQKLLNNQEAQEITEDANYRLECSEYKDPRGTLCP